MEINSKKLDELYKEWSGEHHTTNSNKQVHDSAECTDFAEYCLKYVIGEGKMIITNESNYTILGVTQRSELLRDDYKPHFIEWLDKYFEPTVIVKTFKTIGESELWTLEELHQMYKKAMLQSPFNCG